MHDTDPKTDAHLRMLMSKRTPQERLRMAGSMFDAGRRLLRAGLKNQDNNLTEAQLRARMFVRLYGDQFGWPEITRIADTVPNMQLDDFCKACCQVKSSEIADCRLQIEGNFTIRD